MDNDASERFPTWVMGHRGVRAIKPENSLSGFIWAIENGLRSVEFDVRISADGQLVCVHDETLAAYGGPATPVASMTADEITAASLDVGVGVPLLSAVLDLAVGRLDLNIEIKNHATEASFDPARNASDVLAALLDARRDAGTHDRVVAVSSFDGDSVSQFTAVSRGFGAHGALLTPPGRDLEGIALETLDRGLTAVHPHHTTLLRGKATRYLIEQGLTVRTWTVNNGFLARRLIAAGVESVVTDDPRRLI